MAEENHEFRGFVKAEIKTLKDVAEHNYEEHKEIFAALSRLEVSVEGIKRDIKAIAESRAAKYAMWGAWGGAVLMSACALIKTFT
jgi:hypothetical protein